MKLIISKIALFLLITPTFCFAQLNLSRWYDEALIQPNPQLALSNSIKEDIAIINVNTSANNELEGYTKEEVIEINNFVKKIFSVKSINIDSEKIELATLMLTKFNNDNRFLPAFTSMTQLTTIEDTEVLKSFIYAAAGTISHQTLSTTPEIMLIIIERLVAINAFSYAVESHTDYEIGKTLKELDSIPNSLINTLINDYATTDNHSTSLIAAAISHIHPASEWIPTYLKIFSNKKLTYLNDHAAEAYKTLSKADIPKNLKPFVENGLTSESQSLRRFAALATINSSDIKLLQKALTAVKKEIDHLNTIIDANRPMGLLKSWTTPQNSLRAHDKVSQSNAVRMNTVARGWFENIQTKINAQMNSLNNCKNSLN